MSLDPTEELTKATGRYPFAMAVTAIFFSGSVFVLFNGPLIIHILNNKSFANSTDILNKGILASWLSIIQTSSGIFSISVFLLLSFIAGIIMTPIERLTVTIMSLPLTLLTSTFKAFNRYKPFTPSEMIAADYEIILGWLLTKPSEKSHWEWELFNYYLYWSIATNSLVFTVLSFYILNMPFISIDSMVFFLVCGVFLGFALLHSRIMYKVHQRYRVLSKPLVEPQLETASQPIASEQKNTSNTNTSHRSRTRQSKSS